MSSVASSEGSAASGGNDWLFADPFAYQYSDIPEHERGLQSRSQSPAISVAGSAVSGSSSRTGYTHSNASNEWFELEGSSPAPPPAPRPRFASAVPRSPEKRNVAELSSVNYVPASLVPGRGQAQSRPDSQPQPQPLPHVLNCVNHSEIVRSRHANVRLSRKYPSTHTHLHRRMVTAPAPVPVTGMRNNYYAAGRTGPSPPPAASGLIPVETESSKVQRLKPIRTDVSCEQGLMPVNENSALTPKKDFDSILREIEPCSSKKKGWRNSRAIAYQEKYSTWGA